MNRLQYYFLPRDQLQQGNGFGFSSIVGAFYEDFLLHSLFTVRPKLVLIASTASSVYAVDDLDIKKVRINYVEDNSMQSYFLFVDTAFSSTA